MTVSPNVRAHLAERLSRAANDGRVRLDLVQFAGVLWALFPEDYADPAVAGAIAGHRDLPAAAGTSYRP